MARRKEKWTGPNVGLSDVTNEEELLKVIEKMLQPAFKVMVWRTAMIAKQFALQALEPEKPEKTPSHG